MVKDGVGSPRAGIWEGEEGGGGGGEKKLESISILHIDLHGDKLSRRQYWVGKGMYHTPVNGKTTMYVVRLVRRYWDLQPGPVHAMNDVHGL